MVNAFHLTHDRLHEKKIYKMSEITATDEETSMWNAKETIETI